MTTLARKEIRKLAQKTGLRLTNKEITKFQREAEDLCWYLDRLSNISVEDCDKNQDPGRIHKNKTVFRRDVIETSDNPSTIFKNMPERHENWTVVPKIIKDK